MESERPPQVLLEVSPHRFAGEGTLRRLAAVLAFANVLAPLIITLLVPERLTPPA